MADAEQLSPPETDEIAKTPLTPQIGRLAPRQPSEFLYREGFLVEDVQTHEKKPVLCPYVKQLKPIKHIIRTEKDYIEACDHLLTLKKRNRTRGGTDLADVVQAEWKAAKKSWTAEVNAGKKKWRTTKSPYHERMTKMFVKILCAVKYMNMYHVAHSKLKLDNILVSDEDKDLVQVIAFNYQTEEKEEVNLVKSPDYSSPEAFVFKKERRLTYPAYTIEKDDVWQLGCIIFMMLAHQLPYEAGSVLDPKFCHATSGTFNKEKCDGSKECLKKLLKHYKVLPMFTDSAIDLLKSIFQPEDDRVSLDGIFKHPWLQKELTEMKQDGSLDWFKDTLAGILQPEREA